MEWMKDDGAGSPADAVGTPPDAVDPPADAVGAEGQVEVVCAFCAGRGKDPFGVMYAGSTCQVCGGAGTRRLAPPVADCVYCGGTGVYPGSRLTCTSCGGVGQVTIPDEAVTCPICAGSGRAKDDFWPDSPLPCGRCGGKGVVAP